ncbi:MAG: response regulator [Asticcacaulis sp.]
MSQGSVLVLDDNRAHARHISKMLEAEKWTSVLTFDQPMALSALRTTRFHLLMFDAYVGKGSTMNIIGDIRQRAGGTPLTILASRAEGEKALSNTLDAARAAGADFVLSKPFTPDALKTLLVDTSAFHRSRKSQKSVLVIEDNANLRRMMSGMLSEAGYQAIDAGSMEEAFAETPMGLVDAVIADIFMPGMGGIEGITRIREKWPHIRIIAMSAGLPDKLGAHHVLAASLHVGAVAQLPKPFTATDLIQLLAQVLGPDETTSGATQPARGAA